MFPKTLSVALVVIFLAVLYSKWFPTVVEVINPTETRIVMAWQKIIKPPMKKFQRLVVGCNSNLDYIVPGTKLLQSLNVEPGDKTDHGTLHSLDHLQQTFSHFFSKGAAAERSFMDKDVFRQITNAAENLDDLQVYIGGNAALMATKITEMFPDVKIQYIGPVGPKLKELFPESFTIPESSHIPHDEIHLIMEYKVDESWGSHTAPVATRFITSYDESNSKATMLETFFDNLENFSPDIILLSGLHMLEGQSDEFFSQRLAVVKEGLKTLPITLPVHLELASMAHKDFVKKILEEVAPHISSLGLNEQELSFSSHAADGPHKNDFQEREGQPEIHKVTDMVLWILKTFGYSEDNQDSKLTRVHFHSLTFHIIGTVKGAWHNNKEAVAAGTRTAGEQACDMKTIQPDKVKLRIPKTFKLFTGDGDREFDEFNPVLSWELEGYKFVFSPVLVCINPLRTVGLGDAISSTGLMYSEYNPDFSS
ncbi:ADP-dependent glucokinase-like [Mytilus californianus]|uniref:ADP-dependent glucokinase-like n=1 Tax=Mytilus californianus TaxID=6549 RepID=UPI002247DBC5|nr:ADP-dependent glucokinase-like [Mytilus californianus]